MSFVQYLKHLTLDFQIKKRRGGGRVEWCVVVVASAGTIIAITDVGSREQRWRGVKHSHWITLTNVNDVGMQSSFARTR